MEKLKKLRIKKRISIKQMAEYLNISYAYYWQIENNKRQLYYSLAIKIAKIFDLKPDQIFYKKYICLFMLVNTQNNSYTCHTY